MGEKWNIENYRRESLYKIAIAILVFLLLLRQCGFNKFNPSDPETIVVNSDTVYVKGDTIHIPFPDTVFITKVKIKQAEPEIIYYKGDSSIGIYNTSIDDSLISGNIETKIQFPSKFMIDQKLSYTPKFPKTILRVDTVKIETTIEKTIRNERSMLLGGGLGANTSQLNLRLNGGFRNKKGQELIYGYDILQKSHNFDIIVPIRWR